MLYGFYDYGDSCNIKRLQWLCAESAFNFEKSLVAALVAFGGYKNI